MTNILQKIIFNTALTALVSGKDDLVPYSKRLPIINRFTPKTQGLLVKIQIKGIRLNPRDNYFPETYRTRFSIPL
ncbi:uncharacterized protein RCO7_15117 [Rhynchosporium graminicola]|uniref:Uncharacterized protein n=1 Tax=Rhynchosporium graminicola TaxID=2792576 RepID=A0A1E1LKX2_9HELO|nr:uncharacterized protein RCO7_15117 [Rhynchosporium commune]